MSSLPSPPLPFLPTEVKKEILKFCDQPTLAKTSTLSLAFLQLSSPLLYRHIEFAGPEGLTKFLAIVAEKRHLELEPWLDLSLVRSVTYIDAMNDPFNPTEQVMPLRLRLPSSPTPGRLPLHSLNVDLPADESVTRIDPFFDPVELQLNGIGGEYHTSSLLVDLSAWTRLRRFVFKDAFLGACLPDAGLRMNLIQGLQIDYNLSEPLDSAEEWIVGDLKVEAGHGYGEVWSCIEKVSVLLPSQGDKTDLLEDLAGSILLPRITILVKSSTETPLNDATTA